MFFWMSSKLPYEPCQLWAFEGVADLERVREQITSRARMCRELQLRAEESPLHIGYPFWVDGDVDPEKQIVEQPMREVSWLGCLEVIARIMDEPLDICEITWRVHVFPGIPDVPGATGLSTVAVVQVPHAVADGKRASAMATYMFGRDEMPPTPQPERRSALLPALVNDRRLRRELARDIASGKQPAPKEWVHPLRTQDRPAGKRWVRSIVRHRSDLPANVTVTVGAMSAISEALAGYLGDRGEDTSVLAAGVPVARPGPPTANNNFDYTMVGLYPEATREERLSLIEAELDLRRRERLHPSFAAKDRAFAAIPPSVRRVGIRLINENKRFEKVPAHTNVTSMNRGRADLELDGGRVFLTASYSAHNPMCGLTHGVHGIGDTVAISMYAAESAIPDIDEYLDRLDAALGRTANTPRANGIG